MERIKKLLLEIIDFILGAIVTFSALYGVADICDEIFATFGIENVRTVSGILSICIVSRVIIVLTEKNKEE